MNKHIVSFFVGALAIAIAAPKNLKAETELPYFGPDAVPCQISSPDDPLNAGYLRNENCKVVFVLPPLKGSMGIENFWYSRSDLSMCSYMEKNIKMLASAVTNHSKAQEEYLALSEKVTSIQGAEYEAANQRLIKLLENIEVMGEQVDRVQKAVHGVGGNQPSMKLHISLALSAWDHLVHQYEELNKDREIVFRRLPISGGFINYRMNVSAKNLGFGDLNLEPNLEPVLAAKINGIYAANLDWTKFEVDGGLFPNFLKTLSEDTVLFSGAASGYVDFNLRGACGVAEFDPKANLPITSAGMANFAPTYTYFYPIQSKATFSISLSPDAYKASIAAAVVPGGNVSGQKLYNEISSRKGLLFEYDGGFKNADTDKLRAEYEAKFTQFFTEQLLGQVGTLVDLATKAHTRTEYTAASSRSCSSSLFGLIKDCGYHHYLIPHSVIDWPKVAADVLEKMSNFDPKAKVQKYYNVFGFGTSAFGVEK